MADLRYFCIHCCNRSNYSSSMEIMSLLKLFLGGNANCRVIIVPESFSIDNYHLDLR